MIGASVSLTDGANPSVLFELGEPQVEMPETGNVLMEITEEGGIGSATYYGSQEANGPSLPLTGFKANTGSGDLNATLASYGRVTQFTLGALQGSFTYNANGTFNYEVRKNGQAVFSGTNLTLFSSTLSAVARAGGGIEKVERRKATEFFPWRSIADRYSIYEPNDTGSPGRRCGAYRPT